MNQIKTVIRKQRQDVLECNIQSFDIVAASYVEEIEKRPNNFQVLTEELTGKIVGFQNEKKDCIPPQVCQMIGETNQSWLDRSYFLGGYGITGDCRGGRNLHRKGPVSDFMEKHGERVAL